MFKNEVQMLSFGSTYYQQTVDDRAEPSQAGSVSSARYCSARLGSVFSWNTEPSLINNYIQNIVLTSPTKPNFITNYASNCLNIIIFISENV